MLEIVFLLPSNSKCLRKALWQRSENKVVGAVSEKKKPLVDTSHYSYYEIKYYTTDHPIVCDTMLTLVSHC